MEEGRVGAYGERKIRVCPQRRPRNASGHRARRNQRPKGWRHWIASWRFQPNPFVKWSRVSRSKDLASIAAPAEDRKSTRLNSSHLVISYAVFCLKKKTTRS